MKLRDNEFAAEAAIVSLWLRMRDLYGDKWSHREGKLYTDEGELSLGALRWKSELGAMSADDICNGFRILEGDIKVNRSNSVENWPPSSVEFLALCESTRKKMYQTAPRLEDEQGVPLSKERGAKLFRGLLEELSD